MSIADKITRLTVARNDIRTALNGKGVEASDHGFEDFADDIDSISGGGGDGSMLIEASEMTLTYSGVSSSGKWDSFGEGGTTKSRYIVMGDGRYTITASSMIAVICVVTEIGSTGATATFSPDYPTRIVLQPHTQTVFENCAGMYLVVRSDNGDAKGAVFPTIIYEP